MRTSQRRGAMGNQEGGSHFYFINVKYCCHYATGQRMGRPARSRLIGARKSGDPVGPPQVSMERALHLGRGAAITAIARRNYGETAFRSVITEPCCAAATAQRCHRQFCVAWNQMCGNFDRASSNRLAARLHAHEPMHETLRTYRKLRKVSDQRGSGMSAMLCSQSVRASPSR